MIIKLLRPLSIRGSRFEKDAVVDFLSDDELKAFDPADYEEYTPTVESSAPEVEPATKGDGEQETAPAETEAAVKPKAKRSRKA